MDIGNFVKISLIVVTCIIVIVILYMYFGTSNNNCKGICLINKDGKQECSAGCPIGYKCNKNNNNKYFCKFNDTNNI